MSLYKVLLLSGAAALASSASLASGKHFPVRVSEFMSRHAGASTRQHVVAPSKTAKCGTAFGDDMPQPDGLISWNDPSGRGYDTGGGADFTCSAKAMIKQVWVYGYDLSGTKQDQFNVTFYKNDPANGSDEANDEQVACAYTGLMGAAGSGYEAAVLTQLQLPTPCKFKAGKKYWVSVQNNNANGPWYWEMTLKLSGTEGDWVDRQNAFSTGCATFDNNEYLSSCLGYTYPDYMLELH